MRPRLPLVLRSRVSFALVLLLAAGALLGAGCVGERSERNDDDTATTSDTSDGGDTGANDTASGDTGFGDTGSGDTNNTDTAGGDTGHADAGGDLADGGDDTADLAPDVVEPGTASVELLGSTGPLVGAAVASHRSDGSVLAEATTDALGRAELEVEPDGIITVDGSSVFGERILVSILGVQPDDAIVLTDPETIEPPPLGDISFVMDSANSPQFAQFFAANGCSIVYALPGRIYPLPLDERCLPTGRTDSGLVFAWGFDANNQLVGWGEIPDVQVGNEARLSSFGAFFYEIDIELTSVEAGTLRGVNIDADLDRNGVSIPLPSQAVDFVLEPLASTLLGGLTVPDDAQQVVDYRLDLNFGDRGVVQLAVNNELPVSRVGIDVAADLLPPFESATVDTSGATPAVDWVAPSTMSRADAVLAMLAWSSPSGERRWAIFAPPSHTHLVYPQLPPSLADKGPQPGTSLDLMMMAADASFVHDYAALRAAPIVPFSDLDESLGEYTLTRTYFGLFK